MSRITDGPLSAQIRRARKRHGHTQVQFAKMLGVTPVTVSRWETGGREPRGAALRARIRSLIGTGVEGEYDVGGEYGLSGVAEPIAMYGDDRGADEDLVAAALRLIDWSAIRRLVAAALRQAIAESRDGTTAARPEEEA